MGQTQPVGWIHITVFSEFPEQFTSMTEQLNPFGGPAGAQTASRNPVKLVGNTDFSKSPCSSCGGAPCCRHLPLAELRVDTREDLERLAGLSAFQGILPALREDGNWWLFLRRDCRFLTSTTGMCSIHNTPEQPRICSTYSPYTCWYRRAFPSLGTLPRTPEPGPIGANTTMIQFNPERLEWLIQAIGYSGPEQSIQKVPGWDDMIRIMEQIPLLPAPALEQPAALPTLPLDSTGQNLPPILVVPPGRPSNRRHLDLIRFRLGFPGMAFIGQGDSWAFCLPLDLSAGISSQLGRKILTNLHSGYLDTAIEKLPALTRNLLYRPDLQVITGSTLHLLDQFFPEPEPNPQDPMIKTPA
ncbi:hypothetical protein DC28_06230 [Spirochaeta lutea]|uniref:YkgJ family cysteine cluster protein n=2 Tax=Spirochaeta lutea TaxID=1480694 RepID=A0A098QYX6_9SPIO|nr:hypothetical protein DC28_06230 [Spirochaeta lutea]